MSYKLNDDQKRIICERYLAGQSSESLAREFNVSGPAIRGLLSRRGIKRRSISEAMRTFTCNHNSFSIINTEEQAYWLGFLAADGAITKNTLACYLSQTDREHLFQLRRFLQSNHPIKSYTYPKTSFSRLYIRSNKLVSDLAQYGVTEKKTFTLRWPKIPLSLQHHFIRGYTDGDGGFYIRPTKFPTPAFTFEVTGNKTFITALQTYLMEKCNLSRTKLFYRHKSIPIVTMRYSGRLQVIRIFELLYSDATIYLPRKKIF
ncbi:MAG: hypothetical protein ABC596_05910 [Candidatus Methanosuratincola petrocarbonis]